MSLYNDYSKREQDFVEALVNLQYDLTIELETVGELVRRETPNPNRADELLERIQNFKDSLIETPFIKEADAQLKSLEQDIQSAAANTYIGDINWRLNGLKSWEPSGNIDVIQEHKIRAYKSLDKAKDFIPHDKYKVIKQQIDDGVSEFTVLGARKLLLELKNLLNSNYSEEELGVRYYDLDTAFNKINGLLEFANKDASVLDPREMKTKEEMDLELRQTLAAIAMKRAEFQVNKLHHASGWGLPKDLNKRFLVSSYAKSATDLLEFAARMIGEENVYDNNVAAGRWHSKEDTEKQINSYRETARALVRHI